MLLKVAAVLTMAAASAAKRLEMMMFDIATAGLNLGGGFTRSSDGVLYRIDGGPWKEVVSKGDKAACGAVCGYDERQYTIPELGNNRAFICIKNPKNLQCVPGFKYECKLRYGDLYSTYKSRTDGSFFGFGLYTGDFCGGYVVDVNI
jgi:hypothetical protein